MGVISVSLPSDGSTADVADVNTPITTIVTEFNGNIDNANIKATAGISTSKLAKDSGLTVGSLATGTTEIGYGSGSPNTVIPNAYTTYATVTGSSSGGKVRCTGFASIQDGNSGSPRTGHIRVQCDATTLADSDIVWQTYSNSAYTFAATMPESTPAAGQHTWTFQIEADSASASLLKTYQFSVSEVK